jgi:hypothetical protein
MAVTFTVVGTKISPGRVERPLTGICPLTE